MPNLPRRDTKEAMVQMSSIREPPQCLGTSCTFRSSGISFRFSLSIPDSIFNLRCKLPSDSEVHAWMRTRQLPPWTLCMSISPAPWPTLP